MYTYQFKIILEYKKRKSRL